MCNKRRKKNQTTAFDLDLVGRGKRLIFFMGMSILLMKINRTETRLFVERKT